ncbi:septum formation initiator [Micromonospora olivasterospora]|uniref:Septum formation initiator n=1 Tax=Micromonospora olivasterospora TaxID=1880 RepID=A0A562ICE5_MICOL|nr:septum formation initiator [Micromonospora olivasterospora]TWH68660.1 hypothetical protein JD77_03657 [Micromonospora olivasterospora]
MGRHPLLAVTGWLVAVAVATVVGLAAIRLIGDSITGTPGGCAAPGTSPRTSPHPRRRPPRRARRVPVRQPRPDGRHGGPRASRQFAVRGGSAVAECGPAGVWLVTWTPAPGYREGEVERGPGHEAKVRFVGPDGRAELKVRCSGGQPVLDD